MENLETNQNLLAENEEIIRSIDSKSVNLGNVMGVIDGNNSNESIDSGEPIKGYCDIEELRALLEQGSVEQKQQIKENLVTYLNNSSKNAQRVRMSKNAIIYLSDDGKIIIKEEEEGFTKGEKGLILSGEGKNWSVDAWRTK